MPTLPQVIAIIGPTAVGKTSYSIELARSLEAPIVSFDSRQIYRELSIGVARPTLDELNAVPHYMIASHSIHQPISAAQYATEALSIVTQLLQSHKHVILCGGSGLYLRAMIFGFDPIPEVSDDARMRAQDTIENLSVIDIQKLLDSIDPHLIDKIDIHNPRRVQRVLEVYYHTGHSILKYRSNKPRELPFSYQVRVCDRPRPELYARINHRVEEMIQQGLEDEARRLLPYYHLSPLNTVGYSEWQRYWQGELSLNDTIALIKQHSRNYAKRQLSWCRKYHAEDQWISLK